ncbi:flagellar protein FlaF [Methanomicrobium sp. W14]|uniref:hypothetical protein n=1 Tax=Methanomicrobium sp. W14 TaxID=2817839 RepID=UPI001AE66645|nr:hypothetical protein [Methanomicrobium sp. W14]MBP2132978.1 flagellar protein FlaF [Methanomicrobium sp. W14]
MGSATIIATAFALILLIITAYFLVAVVLTTAEVVSVAQQDKVNLQDLRLRTSIDISNISVNESSSLLYIEILNDGNAEISEYKYWDIYTGNNSALAPLHYMTGNSSGEWSIILIKPDILNPGILDPQETINVSVQYPGQKPLWVQVTTPNGVSASSYVNT